MNKLIKAALEYIKLGIPAIPVNDRKRSIFTWKKFEDILPTSEETNTQFSDGRAFGVAIICGKISGNMEAIDVDCKYDLSGTLFDDLMQRIVDELPHIAPKLVVASTPSGGYHLIYRSPKIEGNKKLALRESTSEEKAKNPNDKYKVLIETRGEAGYIAAVPTPGYKYIAGTIRDVIEITADERDHLMLIARSFNQVIETISHNNHFIESKPMNKSPFADYNERGDIHSLLLKHGWKYVSKKGEKTFYQRPGDTQARTSGDYHAGLGIFSVFSSSTIFEVQKGYRPCAVYTLMECGGDYKKAYRKLLAEGFGEPFRKISSEQKKLVQSSIDEGLSTKAVVMKVADKFDISEEEAEKIVNGVIKEEENEISQFWIYKEADNKVVLPFTKFVAFLEANGFGLYFYDHTSTVFKIVQNDKNRLTEVSSEMLRKFVRNYLMNYEQDAGVYPKQLLLEAVYKDNKLFGDDLSEWIAHVQPDFLRDTKDTCYFPFRNGIVEIKKDGMKILNYGDVNKVIWKSDIRDAHIDLETSEDFECEFSDFIGKICGNDVLRIQSACSILGYLLHKYKHPAKAFAVILGEETEDDAKGGGTGKGLFVKAIDHMMNTETIDGKNFKMDKSFAFQRVKMETKVIVIQDVQKTFDFQLFYSIITEGITIEKKNMDELYMKYEDSPKIVVTSNYTVNDSGNHAKRRQKLIEFSDYFGAHRTPEEEYGHLMYTDWDADEWNRFYNFMFHCVMYYLKNGVIDANQGDKYKRKKINNMFGPEFTDWFCDFIESAREEWHGTTKIYTDFLNINGMDKKEYSQKRFKKALQVASENFGFTLETRKNRQDNGTYEVRVLKNV